MRLTPPAPPAAGEEASRLQPAALHSRHDESRIRLVGSRYELLNELGRGGMGTVYRSLDRLTGRVVTVKRLNGGNDVTVHERMSQTDLRLSLAMEFQLLSSLRHPNIVSVLDYGFDSDNHPFFTMDLQENARTIVEAARGEPLVVRTEYFVQLLRALLYLHRHGIIHRDLKPENVVVVGSQVKVLDFGLSTYREMLGPEARTWGGTLAYLAPEVLRGQPASERSDLYAAGIVGFELFAGRLLIREGSNAASLIREGALRLVRRASVELDPRLEPIISTLLSAEPAGRYHDAGEAIDALASALSHPFSAETVSTRESFLQAAPFVGRSRELETLRTLLQEAKAGRGASWLVAGESGVGKSRLLEELRTHALVNGFSVLRGQAVSEGGGPNHLWREAMSGLALLVELNDKQASVLKTIIPDVANLCGRPIPDPPLLDAAASQMRLHIQVEELFRSVDSPVLVLLEDLQWAGTESIALLSSLARVVGDVPVLLIGTYRSDEAPHLPALSEIPCVLPLARLDRTAIVRLGETMIGVAGAHSDFAAFLERETEGIPFFIVEIVRALAENAGSLARIDVEQLPERLVSGGMKRVLQRRLERVADDDMPMLRTAAVLGREVDPDRLAWLHPDLDFDRWVARCAASIVLELHEQSWRFAHDKLREEILASLDGDERTRLHLHVAVAIEEHSSSDEVNSAALAHHWRLAGNPDKELHYVEIAARRASQSGGFAEAISWFGRALTLLDSRASASKNDAVRRGAAECGLAEAHYNLGDLARCEEHAMQALRLLGSPAPEGNVPWATRTIWEVLVRLAQMARTPRAAADRVDVDRTIASVQARLTEVYFYSLRGLPVVWSILRHLNVAERHGPSSSLAQAYIHLAIIAGVARLSPLAWRWARQAESVAEVMGNERDVANALIRRAAIELGQCRFTDAGRHIERGEMIAVRISEVRLAEEARTQGRIRALYTGSIRDAVGSLPSAREVSHRTGSRQAGCWSALSHGDLLVRLGRAREGLSFYEEAIRQVDESILRTESLWAWGGMALAHLRLSEPVAARECAERALEKIASGPPVAFWTQHGTAATAEVLLTLLEQNPGAKRGRLLVLATSACAGLRRYARRFPLGKSHALLWNGLLCWLTGHQGAARKTWQRAIDAGRKLGTPYEVGRAQLELGRHLSPSDRERDEYLRQSSAIFEEIGCPWESEWARSELERLQSKESRFLG